MPPQAALLKSCQLQLIKRAIRRSDAVVVGMMDDTVLCPRCGVVMELRRESERLSDGRTRVSFYYKCRRCGYRLQDATIFVKKNGAGLELKITEYQYVETRDRTMMAR